MGANWRNYANSKKSSDQDQNQDLHVAVPDALISVMEINNYIVTDGNNRSKKMHSFYVGILWWPHIHLLSNRTFYLEEIASFD